MVSNELKRGTAELAILSVLERQPLHGYEISRRIELDSCGALRFTLAALYPLLYRIENRRWVRGEWEITDTGRRRCYKLLPRGRKMLVPLRAQWADLFRAMRRVARVNHA